MKYICENCGREFDKRQGVRSHQGFCPERNPPRFFKFDTMLYITIGNPKRTFLKGFNGVIRNSIDHIEGAVIYLKTTGQIKDIVSYETKNSPGLMQHENGLVKSTEILKCLSKEDMEGLKALGIEIKKRGKYYQP